MNADSGIERMNFSGMRVHLIGIGGCGMSGAAAVLNRLGARVSGSDAKPFEGLGELVAAGVNVYVGHRAHQVAEDTDLVVMSAAIPSSNAEWSAARARGLTVIKYADLLGWLMHGRLGVAVAGTHGKSTTTAMCAHVFRTAGADPTFIVGARSQQLGGSASLGGGPHFIVESCEFDRSFLKLGPTFAAVLNVEPDHFDCYDALEALEAAFGDFCAQVHADGLVVCNGQDARAVRASSRASARVETFGVDGPADWRAVNLRGDQGRFSFDVYYRNSFRLAARLAIPGRHNVANALAAIALADGAGLASAAVEAGLATFEGVRRRMTLCGAARGVTIVDDYAHHPTEIRCTIQAVKGRYAPRRTWVVFQPHQYNRTRHLLDEFADSFSAVDEVVVPDVYDAREDGSADQSVGSPELVRRMVEKGVRGVYLSTLDEVTEHVASRIVEGDLVLTMGAGDVWKVADGLVARICGTRPA